MNRREVNALFEAALALPPDKRETFIASRCGSDAALRAEVLSLLSAHESAGEFLSEPTAGVLPEQVGADASSPELRITRRMPGESMNFTGAAVGPYRLRERIGEGGFATVYAAEQVQPIRRRVAVKLLKAGMDSGQVLRRFEAERQALALMDHPNIARVFDAGTTSPQQGGRPYFVMELIRGVPITQYCDEHRLEPRERLALLIPVCQAIQHAHQKGVIHRDIKPSNVLITVHDGVPVPKVIDFGIAKAMGGALTDRTIYTEFRQLIGTPAYMSPEQVAMGAIDIDTRSDVYSLGVLMYELLTGSVPFEATQLLQAGLVEMQRIIREVEPPKPSTRASTLGDQLTSIAERRRTLPDRLIRQLRGDLDWIMLKALEKDRVRRYDTVAGMALDLQRYLAGEPVSAAPPSAAYRLRKFVRRHRFGVAAGATIVLALILGIAGTTWQAARAKAAERQAIAQAEIAMTMGEFLNIDLFGSVMPSLQPGRGVNVRMRHLLGEASRRIEAAAQPGGPLANRPRMVGSAQATLGKNYLILGDWDKAAHHLERAIEYSRSTEYEHDTFDLIRNLTFARWRQGRAAEAKKLAQEVIQGSTRIHNHARTSWTVVNLHPPGATSSQAWGVSGGRQVGGASFGGIGHAGYWTGSADSWVNRTLPGAGSSLTCGIDDGEQVGYSRLPAPYAFRAWLWTGTAGSWVDLHPQGAYSTWANAVHNGQQVGAVIPANSANWHAALWTGSAGSWVDLDPNGLESEALAVHNGQQVGYKVAGGPVFPYRASLWTGTAESWVDLNPAGAESSLAYGVHNGQQVGWAIFNYEQHAGLWTGSAASWVDLNPAGATRSEALAVFANQQVGAALIGDHNHASYWTGTAGSWVDLHQFLPSEFVSSSATGIWEDQGVIYVVGYGANSVLDRDEALMWVAPRRETHPAGP
jgi:serine/threonine protein kinase